MRMWAMGTARATLLTASFVALGAGPALADVTDGRGSVLGGNQVQAPISAPINACGNSVAIIGHALSGCEGGAKASGGAGHGVARTSGTHSIGGGNQIQAPISAPINACGNSVAIIGHALSGCKGGAKASGGAGHGSARTSGHGSVLGGNQVQAPVNAPIEICGNAVGNAVAGCEGGATVHGGAGHGVARTSGTHSVLGGNQVQAPISAPIEICGNAVALLGRGQAGCQGRSEIHGGSVAGGPTSGRGSVGGGNQVTAPITVPIDVCGNAAAVIGRAYGSCGADDCIEPSSAPAPSRLGDLSRLPVDASALRNGALPVTMGAMPALPKFPIGRAPIAPMSAPIVPGTPGGLTDVLPVTPGGLTDAVSGTLSGTRRMTPQSASDGLPVSLSDATRNLPVSARNLPVSTGDLPVSPGNLPISTGNLPMSNGNLPVSTGTLPVSTGDLPVSASDPTARLPLSASDATDATGNLPIVGGLPKQLPPVRLVAAESKVQGGALVALALGGLLAASSAVLGEARRLRRR